MQANEETVLGAVALTLVNTLIYYSSSWLGFIAVLGTATTWVLAGIAGYIAGRIRSLPLMAVEFVAVLIIAALQLPVTSGPSYVAQTLAITATAYLIGFAGGLSVWRGQRLRPSPQPVRASADVVSVFIGGVGVSLILKALIQYAAGFSPIASADLRSVSLSIAASVVASASFAYSIRGKSVNHAILTLVCGAIAYAAPLTLPLALAPLALREKGIPPTWVEGAGVLIGTPVKRLAGRGVCRPSISFTLGENNHVIITGSSGTGKTSVAKLLVHNALKLGIPVLILDVHGEYLGVGDSKVISPVNNPVNLLSTYGKQPQVRAEEVADSIANAFRLGNVQKAALYHAIMYTYKIFKEPTLAELLEVLSDPNAHTYLGFSRDVIRSLIPYIKSLTGLEEGSIRWVNPTQLLEGVTIVNLSAIESRSVQRVYVDGLIDCLFGLEKSVRRPMLIVAEEAHRFAGSERGGLTRVFREGRKFGLNVVAVTQEPYSIDMSFFNNCAYIFSMQLTDERSLNYVAKIMSRGDQRLYRKVRETLAKLGKFEALFWERGGCIVLINVKDALHKNLY